MVNCFYRLGHHGVVCRNYKNDNVRKLRTARSHCGKRFVTRSIEEGYKFLIPDVYFVCADVLRYSARFSGYHVCSSDIIEKRCLSVIYVSHYSDDRRSGLESFGIVGSIFQRF